MGKEETFEMTEIILQNLVMPSGIVGGEECLYSRTHASFPVRLDKDDVLDLRAHFNFVPARVLREQGLSEVTLNLEMDGSVRILFYSDNELYFEREMTGSSKALVPIPGGELLSIQMVASSPCTIHKGHYSCNCNDVRDIHLAMVVCTYRRENITYSKMKVIREFLDSLDIENRISVILVDNGRTIGHIEGVEVIPSKNLGGSGGFARGMIEAVNRGYTHILLNDDDALLDPEVLLRTVSLLSIMKEDVIIGGTMLSLERPCMVHESGALCTGPKLVPLKKGVDVSVVDGNIALSRYKRMDYTGWWYSVFPVSVVKRIGYPLPFFFKEDDVEYGLRIDNKMITVCGISIWHPTPKYDPAVFYYYARNHLVTMASHGMLDKDVINAFTSKVLLEISAYRYESAEMMIAGIRDFLKGPDFVYSVYNDAIEKRSIKIDDLDSLRENGIFTPVPHRRGFLFRAITMNGLLLPASDCIETDAMDMETRNFYRMGKILYRVGNSEGFIAKRDRVLSLKLIIQTIGLHIRMGLGKNRLTNCYVKKTKDCCSESSWTGRFE